MLVPSIKKAGLDPEKLVKKDQVNFDGMQKETNAKAWRDIWSAGHGVGAINKIESVSEIIESLAVEYKEALQNINQYAGKLNSLSVK